LSLTDVRPIEEGNKIKKGKPWDEFDVEFPEKLAVLQC